MQRLQRRWWIVDIPVLGICLVCEAEVIQNTLDVRATLDAMPHEPYKLVDTADEASRAQMEVDDANAAETYFGCDVDLEGDADVQTDLAPTSNIWTNSKLAVNLQLCCERYRQWVDLLALNFVKNHQWRPEDPGVAYRLDETEGDRFPEPKVESDSSGDENDVIVMGRYDGSVTLDVAFSGFEPKIIPLMQGGEGKGLAHLGDLGHIKHVVVVGITACSDMRFWRFFNVS